MRQTQVCILFLMTSNEIRLNNNLLQLLGDMLMYVLEQPETTGNVKCEAAQHINDLGVRLDGKKRTYLDSNSAALKG